MGRPCVLIVDDKMDMRIVCHRFLAAQHPEWRLLEAASVEEAVAALEDDSVDVVLTDYRLPDGDGLALADAVQHRFGRPGHRPPSCILMTAYADVGLACSARDEGIVQAFVTKPFDPRGFLDLVELALTWHASDVADEEVNRRLDETVERLRRAQRDIQASGHNPP